MKRGEMPVMTTPSPLLVLPRGSTMPAGTWYPACHTAEKSCKVLRLARLCRILLVHGNDCLGSTSVHTYAW